MFEKQLVLIYEIAHRVYELQESQAFSEQRRISFGMRQILGLSSAPANEEKLTRMREQFNDVFHKRSSYWDCPVHGQTIQTTPCCDCGRGY